MEGVLSKYDYYVCSNFLRVITSWFYCVSAER
jgi:hypothetical protein